LNDLQQNSFTDSLSIRQNQVDDELEVQESSSMNVQEIDPRQVPSVARASGH
jgi:hypothetical protein